MVHYIRFLRVPQIRLEEKGQVKRISAILTVTTDLGETYYPEDLELIVRLVDTKSLKATVGSWQIFWRGMSQVTKLDVRHRSRLSSDSMRLHVSITETGNALTEHHQIPEVLDVWSSFFSLDVDSSAPDYVERQLRLNEETSINIWEATRESIARHIWDGALGCLELYKQTLLTNHSVISMPLFHKLLTDPAHKNMKVVELGSGCGIAGIAFAQIVPGSSVQLTDLEAAQDIITKNIANASLPEGSYLHQSVLDWDEPLSEGEAHKSVDLLIVCECIYNADSCPTLISILQQLIRYSPEVKVLIVTKRRHDSEMVFFELMAKANIQMLEECLISLPHHVSEVDSEIPQAEIYLYGASQSANSKSEPLRHTTKPQ